MKRELQVWVRPLTTMFLWAFALGILIYFYSATRLILLGFIAAAAVFSTVEPLTRGWPDVFLLRNRWFRGVTVGLIPPVLSIAVVAGAAWLIAGPLTTELSQWPQIKANLNEMLARVGHALGFSRNLTVDQMIRDVAVYMSRSNFLSMTTNVVWSVLIALAFIYFGTIFLLGEAPEQVKDPLRRMLPPHRRPQFDRFLRDSQPRLRGWVIGTGISMLVIGSLSAAGYWMIGLRFAFPLAILAALFEVIPTIGPILSHAVALVFAATQGIWVVVGVLIVYACVQLLESHVVLPWVMMKSVRIPPLVTLFTVVFWGEVFGFAGLLVAMPLNLVVWTAVEAFYLSQVPEKDAAGEEKGWK